MLEGVVSMKGSVIKKLKSISALTSLKQGLVFRTTNLPERYFQTPASSRESDKDSRSEPVGCGENAAQIIKDDQEQEQGPGQCQNIKEEEVRPSEKDRFSAGNDNFGVIPLLDLEQLSSASKTTKNPVDCSVEAGESAGLQPLNVKIDQKNPQEKEDSEVPSVMWEEFEERCPPGGKESIVLYTTSMRGIRKTFEDCNSIRFLLESFRVQYNERDVSLHMEYRDELWKIMNGKAVPPRLFIRGRYIGGADEVVGLNERGMLKKFLEGIPLIPTNASCKGCAGVRFVLCLTCNGSRKMIRKEEGGCDEMETRCSKCNEIGLVKCPICNLNK